MATFLQADRPLTIDTPLGKDALLLVGITGQEAVSELFRFHLDVLADNKQPVAFDRLLGQKITANLKMPSGGRRHFNGVCKQILQGARDHEFTAYRLEIVPDFWLLTKRAQSRIFQQESVPDILKKVLAGLDVSFELQGTFQPRDYCVQYRESDFNFACRLMEEEAIYYFFKHSAGSNKMVVANSPQSHPDLPEESRIIFEDREGGKKNDDRIHEWQKVQELRAGKYTLWDHCFELPHKHLDADKTIADSVAVGKVVHKLKVGSNDKLEIYDYPGEYAQRFDGISPGGSERPGEIHKIFEDNKRTVALRMQQETCPGIQINGVSGCQQFMAGHKFTLERHHDGDGAYLLTQVQHHAQMAGSYRTGESQERRYNNSFICIPMAQPFVPSRNTPKPVIHGTQTAVVVGPSGEEIFTDKYSRVKVQFHWDRQGKNNENSSCWVRVATPWAGKQWGMIHIPRIGQEVVVAFEEGDPDRPIIVGSVYNAEMMPPYKLPDDRTVSGLVTQSTLKGSQSNFNELCFEDKKGQECIYFHAEKDFKRVVENDDELEVWNDQMIEITKNRTEKVKEGNEKITIEKGNRDVEIKMGNESLKVSMGNQKTEISLGKSSTEAMQSIELKVGQSSIKLDQTGVTIKGMMIKVEGQVMTEVKAPMTTVKGDAMMQVKGGIIMIG